MYKLIQNTYYKSCIHKCLMTNLIVHVYSCYFYAFSKNEKKEGTFQTRFCFIRIHVQTPTDVRRRYSRSLNISVFSTANRSFLCGS